MNVSAIATGSVQPQITKYNIEGLSIPLPSLDEQELKKEEKATEQIRMLITLHEDKINKRINSIWNKNEIGCQSPIQT